MTVHWFVHPLWFQDIGAFTKEENIEVFVEWAKLAFTLFGALREALAPCEHDRDDSIVRLFDAAVLDSVYRQRLQSEHDAKAKPKEHGAAVLSASDVESAPICSQASGQSCGRRSMSRAWRPCAASSPATTRRGTTWTSRSVLDAERARVDAHLAIGRISWGEISTAVN